jgi:hypothetical protein
MNVVNPDLARDREEQRAEEYDVRNTLKYAAEDHEGNDRDG